MAQRSQVADIVQQTAAPIKRAAPVPMRALPSDSGDPSVGRAGIQVKGKSITCRAVEYKGPHVHHLERDIDPRIHAPPRREPRRRCLNGRPGMRLWQCYVEMASRWLDRTGRSRVDYRLQASRALKITWLVQCPCQANMDVRIMAVVRPILH
ncbi:hypothetical protein L226DRAFT_266406 [Lentinus tigrinus ALCF2SS1-7]|uniref:uncharacterized protein n=1 Tax=Lentinus tigrinus ALCF2SS1-7 TaxID=1328758 RepID=UPI0011660E78|nr:hypothetical protein L226DRAFT_266406 [Lentinus tigrinus ALCF2SS1-7]